jgi:hypothetical protein
LLLFQLFRFPLQLWLFAAYNGPYLYDKYMHEPKYIRKFGPT